MAVSWGIKDLYRVNLREIFALAGVFFCSGKVDKKMKVRERKSDLRKELQW